MAVTISQLFAPTLLTTSTATIYSTPTNPTTSTIFQGRIRFTNTSNATRTVTAYAVQNGGSPSAGNCFLNAEPVAANSHLDSELPVLAQGGTFRAKCDSSNDVTVFQLDGLLFQ